MMPHVLTYLALLLALAACSTTEVLAPEPVSHPLVGTWETSYETTFRLLDEETTGTSTHTWVFTDSTFHHRQVITAVNEVGGAIRTGLLLHEIRGLWKLDGGTLWVFGIEGQTRRRKTGRLDPLSEDEHHLHVVIYTADRISIEGRLHHRLIQE